MSIRLWRLILTIMLVLSVCTRIVRAFLYSFQATALNITPQVILAYSFGSNIKTISKDQILNSGVTTNFVRKARIESYMPVVKSSAFVHLSTPRKVNSNSRSK